MHTFRESVARTYLQARCGFRRHDVSTEAALVDLSEQIPCCNDHDHSFNKLSRLRTSEKCATIHQQFAVTFCAAATEPRRAVALSSVRLDYETTNEAKLVAPREKS